MFVQVTALGEVQAQFYSVFERTPGISKWFRPFRCLTCVQHGLLWEDIHLSSHLYLAIGVGHSKTCTHPLVRSRIRCLRSCRYSKLNPNLQMT